jgi:tetratricopeptide (TPR) repeat protein
MKIKAALLMIFFYAFATGYGFASAEDTLPLSVKRLIQEKNAAGIESEANRFSEAGNKFLAGLAYGEACLLKGDLDKAEIHFRNAMEINPAGIEGKIGMAKILAARKETGKAVQLLNDSMRTSPQPVRLYYETGLILEAAGDIQGAARAFEQGLERYFSKR